MVSFSMRLRLATESDDLAIGELLVVSFLETYRKKMPEVVVSNRRLEELQDVKSRRESSHVIVAEQENEIVGTVTLVPWGGKGSEAWTKGASSLRMMALHPKVQGKNLSESLVQECLRVSREWKAPALQLHVRREAPGLHNLYARLGFKRTPEGDLDMLPEIFLTAYEYRFT